MRTKLLFSVFSILVPLLCLGAPHSDAYSSDVNVAKHVLSISKAYMHKLSLLDSANVTVVESNIINGVWIQIHKIEHNNLSTEYYAITGKDNMVIDGAFLGHDGDAEILRLKFPHDEMLYDPNLNIDFEFKDDTIKALRTYRFFSTARGGNWFHKDGTIYNSFVVNDDGTLRQLPATATATRADGDANYLNPKRKPTTYSNTDGEFFPLGMSVLVMAQKPERQPLNMEDLNKTASNMLKIVEKYDEDAPENPETLSILEFAKWSFNLGMRHSNDFLTWIANNPDTEHFTFFIQAVVIENENNELGWLTENIDNLKDKKARKWWTKWIKENLQWSINNTN